ncbi:Fe-S cluster assembly iron-binding protein IscA [Anaerosolibacter carboniphilus]|uniref:Fe-S cluster assembly iron-binding protein IscA n=1 Tax=Anaerosolibacter carboniphilus TaxID=1417629 RepID=A0A841KU74_9FIRM|nr:Fe-S cluster assembly iron-binding protein IscA [Anaerosolibacter carboniphilus]
MDIIITDKAQSIIKAQIKEQAIEDKILRILIKGFG